jgi:hypothetical protein
MPPAMCTRPSESKQAAGPARLTIIEPVGTLPTDSLAAGGQGQ